MMSFDDRKSDGGGQLPDAREAARQRFITYLRGLPDADEPSICEGFPGCGGDSFSTNEMADSLEKGEEKFDGLLDAFIRVEIRERELNR